MLDSMRALSKSIASKALMLLLVVSFAVWGIGDSLTGGGGPNYAAKVGDAVIGVNEFQRAYTNLKRQLDEAGMKNLDSEKIQMGVIRQLVQQRLIRMAMDDMGLYVTDEVAGKAIAEMPEFRNKQGKFSGSMFNYMLSTNNLTEKAFVADLKSDIATRFLSQSLGMEDAVTPANVHTLETLVAAETRDAVLLTIPASNALDESNEGALKEYYEMHKGIDYLRPETRSLEYVQFTDPQVEALTDASITDTMLDEAVTQKRATSKAAARTLLRKENRDSVMRELINTVEDELAAGKSIAEAFGKAGIEVTPRTLADVTAETAQTTGDDSVRAVVEQGFDLSEGEVSRLITSKSGAMLMVSVKQISAAAPKPYDEVKQDVKKKLARQLSQDATRAKAQTVQAALAKSPNWQAVAAEHDLSSRIVSRVSRPVEGKADAGSIPPALQQAIFERGIGEVAGPMILENGNMVLALVTGSHIPSVETLASQPLKNPTAPTENLTREVQYRALQAFGERHKVEVNPQIIRKPSAGDE